jgi:hypothetical protein
MANNASTKQERTAMIRKLALAVVAAAALGTASLAVTATPAAAGWKGKHFHGFHGHWHGGLRFYAGPYGYYDGCLKRVWRVNRFGEPVLRTIDVCY